jgi:hypothetical protein
MSKLRGSGQSGCRDGLSVMGLYGRVQKHCIGAHDGQRHLDDTENQP